MFGWRRKGLTPGVNTPVKIREWIDRGWSDTLGLDEGLIRGILDVVDPFRKGLREEIGAQRGA